jgi:hypothetical protein
MVMSCVGVAAQAPFPGAVLVDGGWVPCSHPLAVAAGLGCVQSPGPTEVTGLPCAGVPEHVAAPLAVALEVGRFYRTPAACEFKVLAVVRTWQHRRLVFVAETISGRWAACPEVVYFFDVERPPIEGWVDITETIPVEAR